MTSSSQPSASDRLTALRRQMSEHRLDAYLVPSADAHQSEYVPEWWLRRQWISGFTGSAGLALALTDSAVLWADSRYWIQAEEELDLECWELVRQGAPKTLLPHDWLRENMKQGQRVGVDPQVLSLDEEKRYRTALSRAGAELVMIERNLVDAVWEDRPKASEADVLTLGTEWSGEAPASKIGRVQEALRQQDASAHVVTVLDAIAWLFDIRGTDIEFNPIVVSYASVTRDDATLFVDPAKVTDELRAHLPEGVKLKAYDAFGAALDALASSPGKVWIDPATCSAWVRQRLTAGDGVKLHEAQSPITLFKSRKNETEVAGARRCHVRDGVALARFLCWLEGRVQANESVSEIQAAARLAELRGEGEHFRGLSFESISAFASHGALCHYRPDAEGHRVIDRSSLYLIDSGGQYLDGTTDVTRTCCFGEPTAEQRDRFTRVLRGHVDLARIVFPRGTTGKHLDVLARRPLWDAGLNFGHGTGHGVGAFLAVHEGPQSIGPKGKDVPLEPGMILSNEPGYYKAQEYGIRTENLVVVVERKDYGQEEEEFLGFDTITLCPIDRGLIDIAMLTDDERAWVDDYHARVREALTPHLDAETRAWVERNTEPLA